MKKIDFRSDTITLPTEEMRAAIAAAPVGDDVYGEDPTINQLEQKSADLFGKEAALFVTSGTQGNLVSILTHCGRGAELIAGDQSHIIHYEVAGMSALGGVMPRIIPNQPDGTLDLATIESSIRGENIHFPETKLISIENTHNRCNGTPLTVEYTKSVYQLAHKHDVKVHTDGARIFNAAVRLGVEVKDFAKYTDSLTFCLSKGLGAPVGSVIVGDKDFIKRARKNRKMLGGGIRQAGFLAAAGIYALDNHVDRLAIDHQNIQKLIDFMKDHPKLNVEQPSDHPTNILYFSLADPKQDNPLKLVKTMAEKGILIMDLAPNRIRMVANLNVSQADIDTTIQAFKDILA
jgi:threonine aldolase